MVNMSTRQRPDFSLRRKGLHAHDTSGADWVLQCGKDLNWEGWLQVTVCFLGIVRRRDDGKLLSDLSTLMRSFFANHCNYQSCENRRERGAQCYSEDEQAGVVTIRG